MVPSHRIDRARASQVLTNPSLKTKRNGKVVTKYQENFVSDEIMHYTIRRAYVLFRVGEQTSGNARTPH